MDQNPCPPLCYFPKSILEGDNITKTKAKTKYSASLDKPCLFKYWGNRSNKRSNKVDNSEKKGSISWETSTIELETINLHDTF